MATIYADIKGIRLVRESIAGGTGSVAEITFTMAAYTASSDNGQIGGGGTVRGATNTDTLATILASQRRDGDTITVGNPNATNVSLAVCAESGKHGATEFWVGGFTYSGGNILFNVCNTSGTEIDAASGITDREIAVLVSFRAPKAP